MSLASANGSRLTITAVLFVGGESRRMGVDKATLLFEGEPFWFRQTNILRELKPEKLCISARAKPDWLPRDVELISDQPPSRGPLSGLVAALNVAQTTHLLALAVDLPRMNATHLKRIVELAAPKCGVIPVTQHGLEPLCAIYPVTKTVISAAGEALVSKDVSLQHFARGLLEHGNLREFVVGPGELKFYLNANTPEEFSAMSCWR